MSQLPRKSLKSQQNQFMVKILGKVQKRPIIYFGLPFLGTLLMGSFMLSNLTKTRYEYNSKKVKTLNEFERLNLDVNKPKKKFDLREEYFKLLSNQASSSSNSSDLVDQISGFNNNQEDEDEEEDDNDNETGRKIEEDEEKKVDLNDKRSKNRRSWDWDGEQVRVNRLPGMEEWGSVNPKDKSPEIGTRLV